MTSERCHICVLGGGFGGLYTALYFSHFSRVKSGKCQVTLVEKNDRFLFTPLLYELLTQELQRWEIAPSYYKLLARTKIKLCQQTIEDVDLKARRVRLAEGHLTYDYLVLAVGNQTQYAQIPGVVEHTLPFRTLADAELLDQRLQLLEATQRQRLRVAIVGGGPSGVELACKLADRLHKRGQISLLDRGEQLLKPYNQAIRAAAERSLHQRRVQVSLNTTVKTITAEHITLVQDEQIQTVPVDLVLWTAGTKIRDWVQKLECQHNERGQVLTRPTLQLVDYPEVLALGDLAECQSKQAPTTAQVAYQQASRAAKNLKAIVKGQRLRTFHYLHLGDMLTLGKGAAIVSSFSINITGSFGALLRRLIYVQRLPTWRHRLQVLKRLLVG
ncbi:MAG: NAD(P)/FAD-dependent oxidoreductase [Cyanophyceae cyanobacterium]